MRDPGRIDEVVEALRERWKRSPDLRLGQLLVNIARPEKPCPEVFHIEDDEWLAELRKGA